mmetsp:Transcript_26286/g.4552  ORF Transcript_26286/g.4552 Transcript_26286/m.4552 type:complete len:206 (+) Transcript_26286:12696-13313(+)
MDIVLMLDNLANWATGTPAFAVKEQAAIRVPIGKRLTNCGSTYMYHNAAGLKNVLRFKADDTRTATAADDYLVITFPTKEKVGSNDATNVNETIGYPDFYSGNVLNTMECHQNPTYGCALTAGSTSAFPAYARMPTKISMKLAATLNLDVLIPIVTTAAAGVVSDVTIMVVDDPLVITTYKIVHKFKRLINIVDAPSDTTGNLVS